MIIMYAYAMNEAISGFFLLNQPYHLVGCFSSLKYLKINYLEKVF